MRLASTVQCPIARILNPVSTHFKIIATGYHPHKVQFGEHWLAPVEGKKRINTGIANFMS